MAKAPAIETITSRETLEAYLIALPQDLINPNSQAIALRSSLSVLPNVVRGDYPLNERKLLQGISLATLRCIAISRVALKYPTREIVSASAASAASAAAKSAADSARYADSAVYTALSAATTANSTFSTAFNPASAANSAADSARYTALSADSATLWELIQNDLIKFLLDPSPISVLSSPLWWSTDNRWQSQAENFRQALATMSAYDPTIEGAPWLVWWEWYQPQINGSIPWVLPLATSEAIEMRIALGDNRKDFWEREPNVITQEIDGWVREARILENAQSNNLGDRWRKDKGYYKRDSNFDSSDEIAAAREDVKYQHGKLLERIEAFIPAIEEIDKRDGWSGFAPAISALHKELNCETSELPKRMFRVYDELLSTASWLDFDNKLNRAQGNFERPLLANESRKFAEIIRTAAPWIREFPSVRTKDDNAGAFLHGVTTTSLVMHRNFAVSVANHNLISPEDKKLLERLLSTLIKVLEANQTPTAVQSKAGARGIATVRNLIIAIMTTLGAAGGMVIEEGWKESKPFKDGKEIVTEHIDELYEFAKEQAPDVRAVLEHTLRELQKEKPLNQSSSRPYALTRQSKRRPILPKK